MIRNFWVKQRLFYSLATGDPTALREGLLATYARPAAAQWGVFLRTHDELDLGRLTPHQRETVFKAFAPEKRMQLYGRGIRRRLASVLTYARRRPAITYSLMFTLTST